jgi:hypothetical protein
MNTWSTSDWLMFRPVFTLAIVSIVVVAAWVAMAIRKLWVALRAKRREASVVIAGPQTLPNALATSEIRLQGKLSVHEAANDSRPRAA